MRRTKQVIPQRRRIFLGCEGESERSYGALLANFVEERHGRIYLDTVLLQPGGGDPLALVELAIRLMRKRVQQSGGYAAKAMLLDADVRGRSPDRDGRALALAAKEGIRLIWQEPCHEALLLRHLDGCAALRPPTSDLSLAQLQQRWPEYRKGISAVRLAARIDVHGVRRAAVMESELRAFLTEIDFDG
jgi:hypothetical protein